MPKKKVNWKQKFQQMEMAYSTLNEIAGDSFEVIAKIVDHTYPHGDHNWDRLVQAVRNKVQGEKQ